MVVVDEKGITKLREYFVDREKELAELKRYLNDSNDSVGRLIFISGEAGIGKTALVNELSKHATSSGMRFLKGRCLYQENSDPYLPFLDALRQYFSQRMPETSAQEENLPLSFMPITSQNEAEEGTDTASESSDELLPIGLLPIAGGKETQQPLEKIDVLAERDRMFDTITQLIINISHEKTLLLFIDDLQWADTASLQLLHYLARRIAKSRVLICCAYRPEEIEDIEGRVHPLKNALQRINTEKLAITINLHRLSYEHIALMVRKSLEIEEIPDSFLRLLYDESEGHPLFVEEVLKSLIEEGIINAHSYVWDFEIDISKIRMPDTIKDIMLRRISRLREDTKKVLMYCSILGHKFSFDILFRTAEMPEDKLLDAIDELMAAKLIKEEHSPKEELYAFDHVQVRSVVYNTLSKSRVRVMHRKVGDILEEHYKKNIDEVIFSLAHHFTIGKENKKAQLYSERAGDKSTRMYAMDDAIKYYEWALQALEEGEASYEANKKRIELLNKVGDLCNIISSWQSALEYYRKLVKLCEETGEKIRTAEGYRKVGESLKNLGNTDESRAAFEQSLKLSESIKDLKGAAEAHRGLGYIDWRSGQHDSAIAHYNISLQNSMRSGDIATIARTFIDLGNVYNYKGELDKATDYYLKGLDELKKINDVSEIARAYNNLGDIGLKMRNPDKAITYLEKAREYGEKIGSRVRIAWAYFNGAEAYARKGDLKKAKDYADRAHRIMERIGDTVGLHGIYKNYGIIFRLEKKWDDAAKSFNNALQFFVDRKMPFEEAEACFEFGIMYRDKGDLKNAIEYLNRAEKIFTEIGSMKRASEARKELESVGQ